MRSGVTAEQTFAAVVENQLREAGQSARVLNVGIGGERTDQALRRLNDIVARKPDIVTVMYGTNDSYVDRGKSTSRISLDTYRTSLTSIVTGLLRRGITPVLMTEPRWSDKSGRNGLGENPNLRLEPYLRVCRDIARQWRIPLVDHYARWTAARATDGIDLQTWTTDGCHPNPEGHRQLSELLLPVLKRMIGSDLQTRRKLKSRQPVRVVCFGDSVTGVYHHTGSRRAYTDMLGIALRRFSRNGSVEMINAGISGHTTVNALARIDTDVLAHHPNLVTVMFGLNDMTRVSLDDYRTNLITIVRKCRNIGSEVVLATPNNVIDTPARPAGKLTRYCDVVREVGAALNVPVYDCYRELAAVRSHSPMEWRLLMSDAIHPNMDGHTRVATSLAQTITGQRISLDNRILPQPAMTHTLGRLRAGQSVRVLAMPPLDGWIGPAIRKQFPEAQINVVSFPTQGLSLKDLEQQSQSKVRVFKPDLVLIAVPRSASAKTDESFVNSYARIMSWSLNFGPPTWDCIVAHPSVFDSRKPVGKQDDLIRRLVRSQDLELIDCPAGSRADTSTLLQDWFEQQCSSTKAPPVRP